MVSAIRCSRCARIHGKRRRKIYVLPRCIVPYRFMYDWVFTVCKRLASLPVHSGTKPRQSGIIWTETFVGDWCRWIYHLDVKIQRSQYTGRRTYNAGGNVFNCFLTYRRFQYWVNELVKKWWYCLRLWFLLLNGINAGGSKNNARRDLLIQNIIHGELHKWNHSNNSHIY